MERLREERCKHKDNTRCVIEEETEALGAKPLRRPPSGKQSESSITCINTLERLDPQIQNNQFKLYDKQLVCGK